jgi:hypothetical protein
MGIHTCVCGHEFKDHTENDKDSSDWYCRIEKCKCKKFRRNKNDRLHSKIKYGPIKRKNG